MISWTIQAADKVALRDATQECVSEPLPMLGVDVIDDVDSIFAALGSETLRHAPVHPAPCSNASATSAGSSHISDKEA